MSNPKVPIGRAVLEDDDLVFDNHDDFTAALEYGLFYLAHPENADFDPGTKFARSYYLDRQRAKEDEFRGYRDLEIAESKFGYSDPSADQVELFQLEHALWNAYLPDALAKLLHQMNEVASKTLFSLWRRLGIPEPDWDIIANGVTNNDALQYCIFNHFRQNRASNAGFTAHKDSGFITVLYTTEAGLETDVDGTWMDVDPLDGSFTVVLGHSFEVLTENMRRPVRASYHRVRPRAYDGGIPDRISYGVYIGPRFDQSLYQYNDRNALTERLSFLEFQKLKAAEMEYEFHPRVAG